MSLAPQNRDNNLRDRGSGEHGGRLPLPKGLSQWVSLTVLLAIVLVSLLAPLIAPASPDTQDVNHRLLAPEMPGPHLFGTDALGRDIFSRVLFGGRVSLGVSVSATILAAILGVLLGLVAGYARRNIGTLIMGLADAQLAFPVILLAIVFASTVGPSLPNLIVILVLSTWVSFARPVHAMTLSLSAREYIVAARSIGGSQRHILFKHLLPHVMQNAIVLATLQVGRAMLLESTLSFLGMGVSIDIPTWGAMLSDSRAYIRIAPWISIVPGAAIVITVLTITLVGDWLREALNPRRLEHD